MFQYGAVTLRYFMDPVELFPPPYFLPLKYTFLMQNIVFELYMNEIIISLKKSSTIFGIGFRVLYSALAPSTTVVSSLVLPLIFSASL